MHRVPEGIPACALSQKKGSLVPVDEVNVTRLLFEAIYPPDECTEDDYVELYAIHGPDGNKSTNRKFLISVPEFHTRGLDEIMAYADKNNMNLFFRGAIRYSTGAFKRTHCLWLDIDLDSPSAAGATMQKLDNYKVQPTFLTFSGRRGFHALWVLTEPENNPQTVQAKLKTLAYDLDGDHGVASPLKGLRVLGSRNPKGTPPGNLVKLVGPASLLEALNPYNRLQSGLEG